TRKRLQAMQEDLRRALGVPDVQRSRSPTLRAKPFDAGPAGPRPELRDAVAALTRTLIPPVIADRLRRAQHLVVVPFLGIGTVPFSLLQPFGTDQHLLER